METLEKATANSAFTLPPPVGVMLRLLRLLLIAAVLAFSAVNAASVKSMVASQATQNLGLRNRNLLTYVGNVPEHIQLMMMRSRFRR